MRMRDLFKTILMVLFFLSVSTKVFADLDDWIIIQITENDYDDRNPNIDGDWVVWQGYDGNDYEIFRYNIETKEPNQISDNLTDDQYPRVSGLNIVWQGDEDGDSEIYLFNGASTNQLSHNTLSDSQARVSGGNVAWSLWDGDYEVVVYDGSTVTQITSNTIADYPPEIDGSQVVWSGFDGADHEIYTYDIDTEAITPITSNATTDDINPRISGSNILWQAQFGTVGNDYEIFFYDGVNPSTQLTDNSYPDEHTFLSGSRAVWVARDDSTLADYEVFTFNGKDVMQITVNSVEDLQPAVMSDSHVAWLRYENSDYKIMIYDGFDIAELAITYTEYNYIQIWGPRVVWQGHDGNDLEIFLAVPRCHPKPLADLDGNCKVNLNDMSLLGAEWLDCHLFVTADCSN